MTNHVEVLRDMKRQVDVMFGCADGDTKRDALNAAIAALLPSAAEEPVAFRYLAPVGNVWAWTRWLPIDELHHYGADGNLTKGPNPSWRKVEYAYTRPEAEGPGCEDGPWAEGWAERSGQTTRPASARPSAGAGELDDQVTLRRLLDGRTVYVMGREHHEDEHKPLYELAGGLILDDKVVFTRKDAGYIAVAPAADMVLVPRADVVRAAGALEYAAFNLDGSKLAELPRGITDSTSAATSALISARDLYAASGAA